MSSPPLTGLKVLELAGLAPGPFAGVLLADAGADVIRVDRPADNIVPDQLARHKSSVVVNLKDPHGLALVQELARHADVLIDPFRPGVMERLGLGPDELLAANPRLIYGRLTGFRRDGRYRDMAGHDINYMAVSGVLSMLGRAGEKPTPPANILADFAGGGLMLVMGVLMALAARATSGRGQVVEASMVDGAAYLASFPRFALRTPLGKYPRGQNMLDTGSPFYDTYACADADTNPNGYMAVAAIEPQFFAVLLRKLGVDDAGVDDWLARRGDRDHWPALRAFFTEAFRRHPRAHWERVFDGTDACCTPVLGFGEIESGAASHGRESDQRPPVTLRSTPLLAVAEAGTVSAADAAGVSSRRGQGPGVPGGGYEGCELSPGEGGEAALQRWQGWTRGSQYDVNKDGIFALTGKARL